MHRKRKLRRKCSEEKMDGRVKNRMTEEDDSRRKQKEAVKGSLKEEAGKTRGDIDKTMDVDMV